MRILIADDERALSDVIEKRLKKEGYAVDCVYNGLDALSYLEAAEYDAAILDIMMPSLSGTEALESYRKKGGKTPIIFLTAKASVSDRIKGLDAGADDYIVKPFSFDELLARLRSVLRRSARNFNSSILQIDTLTLDMRCGVVKRGENVIDLTQKEYSMLEYMMINSNMILSREMLLSHVWDYSYEGQSNMVDVYIRYLRKKIDIPGEKPLIHTYRGRGYMMGDRGVT